jgi:hypothetical protein
MFSTIALTTGEKTWCWLCKSYDHRICSRVLSAVRQNITTETSTWCIRSSHGHPKCCRKQCIRPSKQRFWIHMSFHPQRLPHQISYSSRIHNLVYNSTKLTTFRTLSPTHPLIFSSKKHRQCTIPPHAAFIPKTPIHTRTCASSPTSSAPNASRAPYY